MTPKTPEVTPTCIQPSTEKRAVYIYASSYKCAWKKNSRGEDMDETNVKKRKRSS